MKWDITVIGAGPTGLSTSNIVACKGYNVLILEEHNEVGTPTHCTGKISIKALEELGFNAVVQHFLLHRVCGATFYSPNQKSFSLKSDTPQAVIIDRKIFDQDLAKKAVASGAKLFTNSRVKKIVLTSKSVKVFFEQNKKICEVETKLIIGADGATSNIARLAGLYAESDVRMSVQREVADVKMGGGLVELYFGQKWAPGFFAWIVPIANNLAKVGLAVPLRPSKSASKYLDDFMNKHPLACKKLKGCRVLNQNVHIIPTGGALRQTISDGVLIVGDAAGQVKSTTGGGLYYGMMCAQVAGKIILKALQNSSNGIIRSELLKDYESGWRQRLGKEISFSVKTRAFLDSLTDGELDYMFDIIRRDDSLIRRIELTGDIDHQSKVALSLLRYAKYVIKKPSLLYKLRKYFPYLIIR